MTFRILYLVHDIGDPAVARRSAMLQAGGASVTLAGFRRGAAIKGALDLGQTYNGKFLQRIFAVIREVILLRRHRAEFQNADLIIARNLEMLALGARGRSLCSRKPVLVYECLDIHRLLLNEGATGQALRRLEGWLAKSASALLTSSPAFVTNYFQKLSRVNLPVRLMENKLYAPAGINRTERAPGPPWRIGWFGAIRCRDSLDNLCELARHNPGRIEIIIRGRPAYDQFDDFDRIVAKAPGVSFLGAYKNPEDLAAIYSDVHFTWAIDHFEAGQNSAWLLPNRIYEGGAYASVPIAEKTVETGRFLDRLQIGVTLDDPLGKALSDFFEGLTEKHYLELQRKAADVPIATWIYDHNKCANLVTYLQGLGK